MTIKGEVSRIKAHSFTNNQPIPKVDLILPEQKQFVKYKMFITFVFNK